MPGGDYQLVPVPITPGMREDIHRNAAAPPGTLRYASNVRWGAMGAAERRNGTVELATTTDASARWGVNSGYALEFMKPCGGFTYVGTDGVAYALRADETGWRPAGRYSSSEPRGRVADIYRAQADSQYVTQADNATVAVDSAGFRFLAYAGDGPSSGVVNYTIQDPDGKSVYSESKADSRRVRACAVGATIYVCIQRHATHEVDIFSTTAGGVLTLVTSAIVTLDASGDSWDMSAWTSTRWAFAALDSSSTTITVRRMNAGTSEATATQSTNVVAGSRVSIYGGTSHVWLGWSDNTTATGSARLSCWNWTGAALSSTFTNTSLGTWTSATQTGSPPLVGRGPSATEVRIVRSVYNGTGHATPNVYTFYNQTRNTAGTLVKAETTQYHAQPWSKPFGPDGLYCVADLRSQRGLLTADILDPPGVQAIVRARNPSTTAYYLLDLLLYQDSESFQAPIGSADHWYSVAQTPSGTYITPVRQVILGATPVTGSTAPFYNIYWAFREFAITESPLSHRDTAEALGYLSVAGQPCMIEPPANIIGSTLDTVSVNTDGVEHGFHRAPRIVSLTSSNSTGALTNAGVYEYVACYRWTDSAGLVHRSPPSAPKQITLGASDDTVAAVITTLDFQRNVRTEPGVIELYRTEAGGSTLFLDSDAEANSVSALTVTITDEYSDAEVSVNRILYTQSQQVQHDLAPACRYLRSSETRMWAAGGWDPYVVQASKIFVPGEPVQWSSLDTFKVLIPKACKGLAFQDGALLAFSETDIYAINTDGGPGNDGLNSFADPRLFCPGIGCEQAASILETPIGVIFRSRRGFELIPRGLGNVQALPGIETTLESYPTIVSSALHVDGRTTTAQFVARSAAGASLVLVFDLDKSAWSVDTYPVDVVQVSTTADGRLLLASENTAVSPAFLVESSSATDDDGVFYQMKLTFHDIYPFGVFKMGAVHSVYARADAQGTCVLNVDIGVDGGLARNCPWTFSGATTFETYREQTPALDQSRGTSIQLSAYDTTSGDAASGVALYGFGLKVADKDSAALLTSAERQ